MSYSNFTSYSVPGVLTSASPIGLPFKALGDFNLTLWGTFTGAVIVPERSFDNGVTWMPFTYIDGTPLTWSTPMDTNLFDPEERLWRLRATSLSTGSVNYRFGR